MKTAIITGAVKGIGKSVAEEFASSFNYNIAIISRNEVRAKRTANEIKKRYSKNNRFKCIGYKCDITDRFQVAETFNQINEKLENIEVLVNNAGVNSRQNLSKDIFSTKKWLEQFEKRFEGWEQEINTNLTGTYICSYFASAYMLNQKKGSIINISSIKGIEPTSSPGYGASKAGIIKLTKDFAKALAPKIRVNCISPGFINCGMTKELPENKKEFYKKQIPFQRFGTVQEIAKLAYFLASPKSNYITGENININGGYLMT